MKNSGLPGPISDFRILELAKSLEDDIRRRDLKAGDPYLTTADCARILEVNTSSANKALQFLSVKQLLHRSPKSGTHILRRPGGVAKKAVQRITLLVEMVTVSLSTAAYDDILIGLQSEFPFGEVGVKILPRSGRITFVMKLLQAALKKGDTESFVLVTGSADIQRLFIKSGLPTILFGYPQPSITELPFIDRDSFAAGRLLAQSLLHRQSRSLMILMRERLLPRDHLLVDGVLTEATHHGMSLKSIFFRSVEEDDQSVRAEVATFLKRHKPPYGLLVQSGRLALSAEPVIRLECRSEKHAIAIADCAFQHPIMSRQLHLRFSNTYKEIGRQIGRLLQKTIANKVATGESVTLPVRVQAPD